METLLDTTIVQNAKWPPCIQYCSHILLIISDRGLMLSLNHMFSVSRNSIKHTEFVFDITIMQN